MFWGVVRLVLLFLEFIILVVILCLFTTLNPSSLHLKCFFGMCFRIPCCRFWILGRLCLKNLFLGFDDSLPDFLAGLEGAFFLLMVSCRVDIFVWILS